MNHSPKYEQTQAMRDYLVAYTAHTKRVGIEANGVDKLAKDLTDNVVLMSERASHYKGGHIAVDFTGELDALLVALTDCYNLSVSVKRLCVEGAPHCGTAQGATELVEAAEAYVTDGNPIEAEKYLTHVEYLLKEKAKEKAIMAAKNLLADSSRVNPEKAPIVLEFYLAEPSLRDVQLFRHLGDIVNGRLTLEDYRREVMALSQPYS